MIKTLHNNLLLLLSIILYFVCSYCFPFTVKIPPPQFPLLVHYYYPLFQLPHSLHHTCWRNSIKKIRNFRKNATNFRNRNIPNEIKFKIEIRNQNRNSKSNLKFEIKFKI